jgi:hypothetical protein
MHTSLAADHGDSPRRDVDDASDAPSALEASYEVADASRQYADDADDTYLDSSAEPLPGMLPLSAWAAQDEDLAQELAFQPSSPPPPPPHPPRRTTPSPARPARTPRHTRRPRPSALRLPPRPPRSLWLRQPLPPSPPLFLPPRSTRRSMHRRPSRLRCPCPRPRPRATTWPISCR